MESLSAMRENPLTYNVMLSELHTISVGSNGEVMTVCEPKPHRQCAGFSLAKKLSFKTTL